MKFETVRQYWSNLFFWYIFTVEKVTAFQSELVGVFFIYQIFVSELFICFLDNSTVKSTYRAVYNSDKKLMFDLNLIFRNTVSESPNKMILIENDTLTILTGEQTLQKNSYKFGYQRIRIEDFAKYIILLLLLLHKKGVRQQYIFGIDKLFSLILSYLVLSRKDIAKLIKNYFYLLELNNRFCFMHSRHESIITGCQMYFFKQLISRFFRFQLNFQYVKFIR